MKKDLFNQGKPGLGQDAGKLMENRETEGKLEIGAAKTGMENIQLKKSPVA